MAKKKTAEPQAERYTIQGWETVEQRKRRHTAGTDTKRQKIITQH